MVYILLINWATSITSNNNKTIKHPFTTEVFFVSAETIPISEDRHQNPFQGSFLACLSLCFLANLSLARLRRPSVINSSNVFSSEIKGPIKAEFHMKPHWVGGNEGLLSASRSRPRLAPCSHMVKCLKKIFSRTKGPRALRLGIQHWGHGPNEV